MIEYDAADNRVLECAVGARSEFIVCDDNDLLRLKEHRNARIIRAAEMLQILQAKADRPPDLRPLVRKHEPEIWGTVTAGVRTTALW